MDIAQVKGYMSDVMNAMIAAKYFPVETIVDDSGTVVPNTTAPTVFTIDTPINAGQLVDIGQKIQDIGAPAFDLVFKTLIDRIGRTVLDKRRFIADSPDVYVDPREWGGFVQWVRVGLADYMDDPMWMPQWEKNYNDPIPAGSTDTIGGGKAWARYIAEVNNATYRPRMRAKIYKEAKAIMIPLSVLKEQLFTAFLGWDEANEFISGLYGSVEDTIAYLYKAYVMSAIIAGITLAIKNGNAINLLAYAHEDGYFTNITTAADALQSKEFMQYASEQIKNIREYARDMTVNFNDHIDPTYTPADDGRLLLLSGFANKMKFEVAANTFNDELIGVGPFKTVPAWQASRITGTTSKYLLDVCARINMTADSWETITGESTEEEAVVFNGILGFFYDIQGVGVTLNKQKTTTHYSAADDKQNVFYHNLFQIAVNDAYNMVVFGIADDVVEPGGDGEGD